MFTILIRPVVAYLRTIGWVGLLYIDDLGTKNNALLECCYYRFMAKDIMGRAGFVFNEDKGKEPSQEALLLGSVIDTKEMKFKIPLKKIEDLKRLLFDMLSRRKCPVRSLARVVGKLCACYRAIGPVGRLMTRASHRVIAGAKT